MLSACTEEQSSAEVNVDPNKEVASEITMIYSDSAVVKFRIISPLLEKYDDEGIMVEEFPEGLKIEFFDADQKVRSWLTANNAIRRAAEGTMLLRDGVILENEKSDRLETSALTWSEEDKTLSTRKFIRMIQGETQDTLYGTGFKANIDFSNFQITNFIGRRKYRDLSQELGFDN